MPRVRALPSDPDGGLRPVNDDIDTRTPEQHMADVSAATLARMPLASGGGAMMLALVDNSRRAVAERGGIAGRTRFPTKADMRPVLDRLVDCGYLTPLTVPKSTGGRPASPRFSVHTEVTQHTEGGACHGFCVFCELYAVEFLPTSHHPTDRPGPMPWLRFPHADPGPPRRLPWATGHPDRAEASAGRRDLLGRMGAAVSLVIDFDKSPAAHCPGCARVHQLQACFPGCHQHTNDEESHHD